MLLYQNQRAWKMTQFTFLSPQEKWINYCHCCSPINMCILYVYISRICFSSSGMELFAFVTWLAPFIMICMVSGFYQQAFNSPSPGMYRLRIVSPRRRCSRSRPCWDPHLLAFGFQTHLWFPEASDPWRLPPIPATAMGILTPNSLHASNPVTKPTGQTTPLFRPGLLRCNWQRHCIRLRCTMWWSDTHLRYEVITISHSHYYLVVVTVVRTFKM